MDPQLQNALMLRKTDLRGALYRLCGDEKLYITCLKIFIKDNTLDQMNKAIAKNDWDDAFTAAHALKGVAGNMGFVPLMHSTGELVIAIRGGRTKEIGEYAARVNSSYRDIVDAIQDNISTEQTKE